MVLFLLSTVVVPAVLVGLVVVHEPELSPLDETAHIDYLRRVNSLEFPRMGEVILPETGLDFVCRRDGLPRQEPPCTSLEITPKNIIVDGYSYEAQHPPFYYLVSAALQRVVRVGPFDDFVVTARLTGVFWFAAGLATMWLAARRLGATPWAAAGACLLLSAGPLVVFQTATVTNDATSLLAGGLSVLSFLHLRDRPGRLPVLVVSLVAAGLVLFKPVNVIVVGALALALLLDGRSRGRTLRELASPVLGPSVAAFAAYFGWVAVRNARAIVATDEVLDSILSFKQSSEGLPVGQIVLSLGRLFEAYDGAPTLVGALGVAFGSVMSLVLFGPAVADLLASRRPVGPAALGIAAIAILVVAGGAVNVQFWLENDLLGGPPARYGISVLPFLAVNTAVVASRSRWATVALAVLAVLAVLVTGWAITIE